MKSPGKCEEQQRISVHWSQEKKSISIRAKLSFTCIVLVFATLNTRTMQVLARITYLASFLRPPNETKTQLFDNLCTSRSKKRKKKNSYVFKVSYSSVAAWACVSCACAQSRPHRGKLRVTFAFPTDPSAREGRANKVVQECGCDTGN